MPTRRDNGRARRTNAAAAALLAICLASNAAAQVSGDASVLSDYRFRGVSLSQGDPAAQVDINFDAAAGWFAGLFASTIKLAFYPAVNREVLPYAGYAYRLGPDLSVEAGASYADFSSGNEFDYVEAHAGITTRLVNLRLAYAPRYFGQDRAATYLELNSGTEIAAGWRVFGHAGVLAERSRRQYDGRLGVRYEWESLSVQLSRVAVSRVSYLYPAGSTRDRGAWVVQATKFF